MQKIGKQQSRPKQVLGYQPPNHLEDDFLWELFKLTVIAGLPTLLLFYTFEIFIPFGEQVKLYEKKCTEKGGYVYSVNQERACLEKDAIIKIE